VNLAVKRREKVFEQTKQEDRANSKQRRENMQRAHLRRQALEQRALRERNSCSYISSHLGKNCSRRYMI